MMRPPVSLFSGLSYSVGVSSLKIRAQFSITVTTLTTVVRGCYLTVS